MSILNQLMMNNNIKSAFDPIAWANADAANNYFTQRQNDNNDDTVNQVCAVADEIVSRSIDITEGYDNWLKLGFALADGLGESGREIFHNLSRLNIDYETQECDRQYSNCLRNTRHGITIRTFFQMAKDAGIDLSATATSAIPPTAKIYDKVEESTILCSLDNEMAVGGMAEVAEKTDTYNNGYTFSDKLNRDDLVDFIKKIIDLHNPEPAKCDAQLIGVLNAVGGMMGGANGTDTKRSGIYGIYDGRRVYAQLYNIIYSGAGNDKGNLIFCKHLLHAVKNEMLSKYQADKKHFETEFADWENKNKKERGAAPQEPVYRNPFVPGNSSSSAVYRAMDANGGWGMMFETEADTISSMIESDYGNYSDLMRKAYHHEPLTMNRVTEKVHIDINEPRLSIFLTCTPGQLPSLFPSFENGLGSRFLFYNIPDTDIAFHDVFARRETPLEDIYRQLGQELLPLYHAMQMRENHPIQFVMSQQQQREFMETYTEILHEQFQMLGKGIRAFVFRTALACFRYAMILTTLRRLCEWNEQCNSTADTPSIFREDENALVCDDRDFHTAITIIGCLINHTARVYAVLQKEDHNPFATRGIHLSSEELKVFEALPEGEFQTAEFLKVTSGMNIPERTAQRMLSQFCNVYTILNPVRRGTYYKPQRKEE